MSRTVHPYSHRLGILRDWRSRWFAAHDQYPALLKGDILLREFLTKRLKAFYVSGIDIERGQGSMKIIVRSSRPGMIIGRSGEGSQKLKKEIIAFMRKRDILALAGDIKLDVEEVRSPESDAALVAKMVAEGLEKRMPFRRVLKQTAEKVMANRDVKGVRIKIGGVIGGAMARKEETRSGRIPLQTMRADIDFARERANVPLGAIGIKVWIYEGEVFAKRRAAR